MPFKSEAQRRKFAELVKQGKVTQKTYDEFNSDTPKKIPERIKPKKAGSSDALKELGKRFGVKK